MSVSAARPGRCAAGRDDIEVGEVIVKTEDYMWSHPACLDRAEAKDAKPVEVCDTCFMVKAVDGSCLC